MHNFKYLFVVMLLVIFFAHGLYSIGLEGRNSYTILKKFYGLSDDQKRNYLIGDLYRFAAKCNSIIPYDSSILYLSSLPNNRPGFDLLVNYYLYPRKLYWLNNTNPYPESPPDLEKLDPVFLSKRDINWVILRYPEDYGVNQVVKLEHGTAVQSFTMD